MDKPYFAVFCLNYQTYVVYGVSAAGFKENEIAFLDILKRNKYPLFSHISRYARQCYVFLLEGSIYQAGTVHPGICSAAKFITGTLKGFGVVYNSFLNFFWRFFRGFRSVFIISFCDNFIVSVRTYLSSIFVFVSFFPIIASGILPVFLVLPQDMRNKAKKERKSSLRIDWE